MRGDPSSAARWSLCRRLVPTRNTRALTKRDMLHNDALPAIVAVERRETCETDAHARPSLPEIAELLRVCGGVKRDQESFGRRRRVADQREIKAGVVMSAGVLRIAGNRLVEEIDG